MRNVWAILLVLLCPTLCLGFKGSVRNADGSAAGEAEVTLRNAGEKETTARCDGAGLFAMDGPTTVTASLLVRAGGAVRYASAPLPRAFFTDGLTIVLPVGTGAQKATSGAMRLSSIKLASVGAYTLGGTIYGGSSPLANAQVDLYDQSRTTVLGTMTTDSSGQYSFPVDSGTYDLKITPPVESGFKVSYVNDVAVSGKDVTQNIVLIAEAVTLSGAVRLPNGTPVNGVRIYLAEQTKGTQIGYQDSGADGSYSFSLASGTYTIEVTHSYQSSGLPQDFYFQFSPLLRDIVLTESRSMDLVIPLVYWTGRTIDSEGNPVGNVNFSYRYSGYDADKACLYYLYLNQNGGKCGSDASGNFSIPFAACSSIRVDLAPPAETPFGRFSIKDFQITADLEQDLVIPPAVHLSGTLRSADGTPVRGLLVALDHAEASPNQDPYQLPMADCMTGETGDFSLPVSAGSYYFKIMGGINMATYDGRQYHPNIPVPSFFLINKFPPQIDLTTDTVTNLTLPFVTLRGKVTDSAGQPISRLSIYTPSSNYWSYGGFDYQIEIRQGDIITDEQGNYAMPLLPCENYQFFFTPPPGSNVPTTSFDNINVTTDTVRDFVLPEPAHLRGTIRTTHGEPISNVYNFVTKNGDGTQIGISQTDASGTYDYPLAPGSYMFSYTLYDDDRTINNFSIPSYLRTDRYGVNLTADTTLDIDVPLCNIAGKTTDRNCVPIPNVAIEIPWTWWEPDPDSRVMLNDRSISDSFGSYRTALWPHTYSEVITPSVGSGFAQTVVNDLVVDGDSNQNIILNYVDTIPPRILAGPYVNAITDQTALVEWETDEPATSVIGCGVNDPSEIMASTEGLGTHHSVQVSGLTADTIYKLQVSSADEWGNGPTRSEVVTFKTEAGADLTAPQILEGPVIRSITQGSATVEWTTDEPSSASVAYGKTEALGLVATADELMQRHAIQLTGLESNTVYYIKVASSDGLGNGPTESNVLSFTTLTEADTTAPAIIAGPMAIQVTDTEATIVWSTDEPASSGVSYNDGSKYGVFHDDMMLQEHSVRLTGLKTSTQYNYTVSSADAQGNGPTLSQTLTFTTLATPDTDAPRITEGPLAMQVTYHSALIRWITDEPADSVIEYGTAHDNLDQKVSQAGLVRRHSLSVTDLEPGTRYFFRVLSTDANGNGPTASKIQSFRTEGKPRRHAPVFTDGPRIIGKTNTTATIYWQTDTAADSVVEYGVDSAYNLRRSDEAKVTEHQMTLSRLRPNQAYSFRVSSTDMNGDTAVSDGAAVQSSSGMRLAGIRLQGTPGFTTNLEADTAAPIVTEGPEAISVTNTTAIIRWVTDEIADSRVSYGINGTGNTQFAGDISQTQVHQIALTNLSPSTTYVAWVGSADVSGNLMGGSIPAVFTTVAAPDTTGPAFAPRPSFTAVSPTQVKVAWGTDELATSQVQFGTDPGQLFSLASQTGLQSSHSVTLGGLQPGALYYYAAVSADSSDNQSVSQTGSFRTAWAPDAPPDIDVKPAMLSFTEHSGYEVDVESGGTSRSLTLTIKNTGTASLKVTGLTVGGTSQADFKVVNPPELPFYVEPGASQPLAVRFAPAQIHRTLGLSAKLTIASDDPDEGSVEIPITGDAVPVELSSFSVE